MSSNERIQETKDEQSSVRELALDLIRKSQELRRENRILMERNICFLAGLQRRWLRPVRQRQPPDGRKWAA
jgi:hypothetical protein